MTLHATFCVRVFIAINMLSSPSPADPEQTNQNQQSKPVLEEIKRADTKGKHNRCHFLYQLCTRCPTSALCWQNIPDMGWGMAELIKLSGFLLYQNHHPLEGTIAASGSAVLPVSLCLHKGVLLAAVSILPRYAPGRCRCVGSFPSLAKRCDGDLGIHTE